MCLICIFIKGFLKQLPGGAHPHVLVVLRWDSFKRKTLNRPCGWTTPAGTSPVDGFLPRIGFNSGRILQLSDFYDKQADGH